MCSYRRFERIISATRLRRWRVRSWRRVVRAGEVRGGGALRAPSCRGRRLARRHSYSNSEQSRGDLSLPLPPPLFGTARARVRATDRDTWTRPDPTSRGESRRVGAARRGAAWRDAAPWKGANVYARRVTAESRTRLESGIFFFALERTDSGMRETTFTYLSLVPFSVARRVTSRQLPINTAVHWRVQEIHF